ncbi:MAG: hypothetical protein HY735_24090 [Verrucomicrobia bacterium]|nr:hypothetical protein [Verrucomicrobiota bacterium]
MPALLLKHTLSRMRHHTNTVGSVSERRCFDVDEHHSPPFVLQRSQGLPFDQIIGKLQVIPLARFAIDLDGDLAAFVRTADA